MIDDDDYFLGLIFFCRQKIKNNKSKPENLFQYI